MLYRSEGVPRSEGILVVGYTSSEGVPSSEGILVVRVC